jgi:hypothetical protein
MQRVTDLADSRRCKGASVDGQCQNVAEEGSDYCRVHGGKDQAPARRLKQYLLTKAQDRERLAQFAENDALKTLREEVVVALGQLERRLNLANRSDAEFLAAYPEVEKSLKLLAELKKSNLSLEEKSGATLSREQGFALVRQMIEIIVDELEGIPDYERVVDSITMRILATVQRPGNSEVGPA